MTDAWDVAADAVLAGDVDAVRRLAPAVIADRNAAGDTLLTFAADVATGDQAIPPADGGGAARWEVIEALLEAGADPDVGKPDGWTALHCAGLTGNERLAQLLLGAGASRDVRHHDLVGATPLGYACFYAKVDSTALLAGDDPAPDDLRTAAALGRGLERFLGPPLHVDAGRGMDFAGPIQWFPERSAPIDDQTILDEALGWASRNGRLEAMATLVDAGADVNANPYRGTALLWATYSDQVDAAAWLLDAGADPDLRHDFGGADHGHRATALHLAAQFDATAVLALLLERGADPTITDAAHDATPLEWATHAGGDASIPLLRAHLGLD